MVSRRVQETGILMVLGAQKRDIIRLVVSEGMRSVLIGIGLGFGALSFGARNVSEGGH